MEHWSIIPDSLYEISDLGRVRNTKRGTMLKARRHTHGYLRVSLGAAREEYIHRLVCAAFNGACPEGMQCDHINGVRDDNRATNLRWVTPEENKSQRQQPRGERNPNALLKTADVAAIRSLLPTTSNTTIAARFGVHRRTIADIRNGVTWI